MVDLPHAVRTLGLLAGGVGPDRRTDDLNARVHGDDPLGDFDGEAVEPARCRATLLLSDAVVLRAVAAALEPLRARAERHAAAEVDALLVERDDAGLHAGQDRRRVHLL